MLDIQKAIDQWRLVANNAILYPSKGLRDACERAAVALEIQRDTGIVVCTCCHKEMCDKVWWKQRSDDAHDS
jgi:hypothetical protein